MTHHPEAQIGVFDANIDHAFGVLLRILSLTRDFLATELFQ
jgi:hypothetical protein